uniref:Uncharacterized protein n=1 Tax=Cucumis melo subsp. melo TaxID=412675 RepID=E5GCG4_CUCME|nr:hypothetical protein [Cucumis melo subsp. melo]
MIRGKDVCCAHHALPSTPFASSPSSPSPPCRLIANNVEFKIRDIDAFE